MVQNYLLSNREHAIGDQAKSGNAANGKSADTFGLSYNFVGVLWIFIYFYGQPITYFTLYTSLIICDIYRFA